MSKRSNHSFSTTSTTDVRSFDDVSVPDESDDNRMSLSSFIVRNIGAVAVLGAVLIVLLFCAAFNGLDGIIGFFTSSVFNSIVFFACIVYMIPGIVWLLLYEVSFRRGYWWYQKLGKKAAVTVLVFVLIAVAVVCAYYFTGVLCTDVAMLQALVFGALLGICAALMILIGFIDPS